MAALASADPGAETAAGIAERWAEMLLAGVASGPELWDRDGYRANCVTLGTDVTWDGGGKGRAVDIDEAGGLVVETPGGLTTLRSGRVREVRPATVDGKGVQ
jgi:BirA family biotin operon repressor/biotin-[acetyl-CoA-carboxylase] ligase